jgi:hypothetical protein
MTREPRSSRRSADRPTKGSSWARRDQSAAMRYFHTSSGYQASAKRASVSAPPVSMKTGPAVTSKTD